MEKKNCTLNEENLEDFLTKDASFVEYFNSFLTLQSFPKRVIFNCQRCQFEEFHNTLIPNVNTVNQNFSSENQAKINYFVKVLDKSQGLEWVKRHRLPLFLQSEIYADYKLSCQLCIYQGAFIANLKSDANFQNAQEILDNKNNSDDYRGVAKPLDDENHYASSINDVHSIIYDNAKDDDVPDMVTKLFQTVDEYPVDISRKQSLDAFKEFLYNTEGEKNMLLWLEVERLSRCSNLTKRIILNHIKDRFFRAGSSFEINVAIRKKWGFNDTSEFCIKNLLESKGDIIEPLLNYWCHRFTIHQLRRKKTFIENAGNSFNMHCKNSRKDLPQRPLSCMNHLRSTSNLYNATTFNHMTCHLKNDESYVDNGVTRKKIRSKSAYTRLLSSPIIRNTNIIYGQQNHSANSYDDGFGYKPPDRKYYHNDAATIDHRENVRLYIDPIPYPTSNFSTISSVPFFNNINRNLDSLVNGLLHEKHMGLCFFKYLQKLQCKQWIDCYMFWLELQVYNEYFFAQIFNEFIVKRKANQIFSTYIAKDSLNSISCSEVQYNDIIENLNPPFEDLFDDIEKKALNVLVKPWLEFTMSENYCYEMIKTSHEMKFVELYSRKKIYQNDLDIDNTETKEEEEENEVESDGKFSVSDIADPSFYKYDFSMDKLVLSKSEMEYFQLFLEENHKEGLQDLAAWTDIEIFCRLSIDESAEAKNSQDNKLQEIQEKWLGQSYFLGAVSPASKEAINKIFEMSGGESEFLKRPSTPAVLEIQKYIRARIERKWLMLFTETEEYNERKKINSNLNEIVEDLIMKKKIQRSEHAWKLLNNSVNTNSYDVASFRITLNDSIQCEQFRRFICLKGDLMENNLKFWLEVQKYKKLCHHHVNTSIVEQKLHTIIDVFIKSQIPPEIQIDVPIEIAERLYDKVYGRFPQGGPYLFREAQSAVFRIMFSHWKEFMKYCNELSDNEKLNQSLSKMEKQHYLKIECQKLNYRRSRFNRLINDQRKQEMILKEREQLKKPSLLSFLSKSSSTDVTDNVEPSFLYSRHNAIKERQSLEEIMKNQGIAIQDDEDFLKHSMKTHDVSNYSSRKKSTLSIHSQVSKIVQNITSRRQIETSGTMHKRKQSLRVISNGHFETPHEKSLNFENHSKVSQKMEPISEKYKKSRFAKSSLGRLKLENDSDAMSIKSKTKAVLIPNDNKQQLNQGFFKEKPGVRLTRKYLKDFERSPEGKPLDIPLPLVRITNIESPSKMLPITSFRCNVLPSKCPKDPFKNERLPRNAGTAAIIAKMMNKERKKPQHYCSSSTVVPEVIVC